jgi:hypothetical protein
MCLHQSYLVNESRSAPEVDSSSRALLAVDTASRMLLEACAASVEGPELDWDAILVNHFIVSRCLGSY